MSVNHPLSARAGRVPATPAPLGDPATVELTVVIPFFNPGAALRPTVLAAIDCLRAARVSFEIIAVCDGCTDGSAATIAGLPHVRLLSNPRNLGKGVALRRGFAAAAGAWIGFIDADGDIDPRHLVDYLQRARAGGNAGVYADKRHADSGNAVTGKRRAMSATYSTLVSTLFRMGVRDTQTGCKLLRRDVVARILPCLRECGFALDLELFAAARRAGITDFVAAPVEIRGHDNGSTVCCRTILRTIRDTMVVYGRHLRELVSPSTGTAPPPARPAPPRFRRPVAPWPPALSSSPEPPAAGLPRRRGAELARV
jgi:glycosyltransferase involved in cell wall biosynthesis